MDQLQMNIPGSGGGGGSTVTTGVTTINFGSFPGSSDASVTITGQAGILSTSLVSAWLIATDTSDHLADEHVVETIEVRVGSIVAGTGFTIYAVNRSTLFEPLEYIYGNAAGDKATGANLVNNFQRPLKGNKGTLIYGEWTVGWMWI